jgi:hypothetical protein
MGLGFRVAELVYFDVFMQHPGFDFSQAEFSGSCPNPKTFLGGIKQ